jgi:hypothetical protein
MNLETTRSTLSLRAQAPSTWNSRAKEWWLRSSKQSCLIRHDCCQAERSLVSKHPDAICVSSIDFVAGMTDSYLLKMYELKMYERLFAPRMGSVFDNLWKHNDWDLCGHTLRRRAKSQARGEESE